MRKHGFEIDIIRWMYCLSQVQAEIMYRIRFWFGRFLVFNSTCNNISVISWQSVLLVEETRVSAENHRPVVSLLQTLSYNVVLGTPRHGRGSNSQL